MTRRAGPKKSGFIIMAVFFFTLVASIVGMVAVSLVARDLDGLDMIVSSSKALYISQAGMEYTKEILSSDLDWTDNALPLSKTFAGGSFTVTFSNQQTASITAQSVGVYGSSTRQMTQSFVRSKKAFEYCVYSGRSIDLSAASGTIIGDLGAENSVTIGAGVNLSGDVDQNLGNFFPDVTDYNYWKNMAIAQGQYANGKKNFQDGHSYSGVWYVKGDVTIRDVASINGTIVTDGNINIVNTAGIVITAPTGFPALVAKKNITADSSVGLTVNGLIYAKNKMSMNLAVSPVVYGGIMAGQNIDMVGVSGLSYTYNGAYMQSISNFSNAVEVVSMVSDWQES